MTLLLGFLRLASAVLIVWGVALLYGLAWALITSGLCAGMLAAIIVRDLTRGRET